MGKKSDPPPAPDYTELAKMTAEDQRKMLDLQTAANRPGQVTPWGTSTWEKTPTVNQSGYEKALADWQAANQQGTWVPPTPGGYIDGPDGVEIPATPGYWTGASSNGQPRPDIKDFTNYDWTQKVSLDPADQAHLDAQRGIQSQFDRTASGLLENAHNTISKPLDFSGLPQLDPSFGAVQEVQDAMMSRLTPQLQRNREAELQRLRNQGISDNSEAFQRALTRLDQSDVDASMQALLGATQAYGDIFSRTGQARQQGITEQNMIRQSPLDDLMRLNGQPVGMPQMPSCMQAGQGQPIDYLGAGQQQFNAAMNAYNADQASGAGMLGGLFGLAGSALGGPMGGMLGTKLFG